MWKPPIPPTATNRIAVRKSRNKPPRWDHPVRIDDAQEQAYVITFPGNNDGEIDEKELADLELEAVPDRTVRHSLHRDPVVAQ